MELSSIVHFADRRWCFALEKGRFLFRIRTGKGDVRRAVMHYRDKYIPLKLMDTRASVEMRLAASDRVSDYFETEISMDVVCLRYFFELEGSDGQRVFYGDYKFSGEPFTDVEEMFDCPQQLREEEMAHIPEWAAGKVAYQIFPARYASSTPAAPGERPSGDLGGIAGRLDHLKELGVDILYLTPIFLARSVHKYDTVDYFKIDPSFGTEEDLRALVEKAHALGMRVILDAVFNHTSTAFFAFADIMEKGPRSKYLSWYHIRSFPLEMEWGKRPSYLTFSYAPFMPKLDLRDPGAEAYFLEVGRYWIRSAHIDGWRLDVGDEVGHRFWRRFREAVREVSPEALIVGEEWHYAGDFLEGDAWDTVMNYPFQRAVTDLVARETVTVSQFLGDLGFLRGNLHPGVWRALWNLIDSHDTPRFLYSAGGDRAKQRLAAALQMLLPGTPVIYYGDEFGMDGGPDPDCRRHMVWDAEDQDRETFEWYKRLIRIRHAHPCLSLGEATACLADDEKGVIALAFAKTADTLTALFHCKGGEVDLPDYAGWPDLLSGGVFTGTLPPWSAAVLVEPGKKVEFSEIRGILYGE